MVWPANEPASPLHPAAAPAASYPTIPSLNSHVRSIPSVDQLDAPNRSLMLTVCSGLHAARALPRVEGAGDCPGAGPLPQAPTTSSLGPPWVRLQGEIDYLVADGLVDVYLLVSVALVSCWGLCCEQLEQA